MNSNMNTNKDKTQKQLLVEVSPPGENIDNIVLPKKKHPQTQEQPQTDKDVNTKIV